MSEFKVIETQEQLDAIIKDRLSRNTKTVTDEVKKQYEGYISPDDAAKGKKTLEDEIEKLKKQITEKDTSISSLEKKNKEYEIASVKAKIAREHGLPAELAERLKGENEEEYKADAEALSKIITPEKPPAPMFNSEGGNKGTNSTDAALLSALDDLSK